MSLRYSLFLILLVLGTAPLVGLALLHLPDIQEQLSRSAQRETRLLAQAELNALSRRIEQRRGTMRLLRALPVYPELLDGDTDPGVHMLTGDVARQRFATVMGRWFGDADDVRDITVMDRDGRERLRLSKGADETGFRLVPAWELRERQDRPCYQQAVADDPGVIHVILLKDGPRDACYRGDPREHVMLATQLVREDHMIGVLVMSLELDTLLGSPGDTYWVDGAGRYLKRPGHPYPAHSGEGAAFADFPGLRAAGGSGAGPELLPGSDGRRVLWLPLRLAPGAGKLLWIGHPVEPTPLQQWLRGLGTDIAVTLAVLVAVVAVIASMLVRYVERARGRILETVRRILDGESPPRLPWRHPRELRVLADDLEALAQRHARLAAERRSVEQALRDEQRRVSELNATQEQRVLERTEELGRINQELEAFSYSVSHDLRGPLHAIDGFAYLLEEDHGAALDEVGRGYVRRLRQGVRRMSQLIDALLTLSRVSRHALSRASVDLSRLAGEVLLQLRERDPERDVTADIQPGVTGRGDEHLLRIVLENLLSNAWKYTANQADPRIGFHAEQRTEGTVYCVSDNGAGFDMDQADKLFAPFQRLHGEDEYEGSGIGLATVRRVINRHGGRVWAESRPGEGARFYFTLGG